MSKNPIDIEKRQLSCKVEYLYDLVLRLKKLFSYFFLILMSSLLFFSLDKEMSLSGEKH